MKLFRSVFFFAIGFSTLILTPILEVPCQDQVISFNNNQIVIGDDSELSAENFLSEERTLIVIPKEGSKIASAKLIDGTQTTTFSANKITLIEKTSDFVLDGEGTIEWNQNRLSGPTKIVFDNAKSTLTIIGTKNNPASVRFLGSTPYEGRAEQFIILGKDVDGKWTPKDFKTKGNRQSILGTATTGKKDAAPGPKLTSPK